MSTRWTAAGSTRYGSRSPSRRIEPEDRGIFCRTVCRPSAVRRCVCRSRLPFEPEKPIFLCLLIPCSVIAAEAYLSGGLFDSRFPCGRFGRSRAALAGAGTGRNKSGQARRPVRFRMCLFEDAFSCLLRECARPRPCTVLRPKDSRNRSGDKPRWLSISCF